MTHWKYLSVGRNHLIFWGNTRIYWLCFWRWDFVFWVRRRDEPASVSIHGRVRLPGAPRD